MVVDFCIGLGVNEIATIEKEWIIYPNPASDFIIIKNTSSQNKKVSVCIFNSIGELVLKKEMQNVSSEKMDVTHFNNGLYLIVMDDQQKIVAEKFMVMK